MCTRPLHDLCAVAGCAAPGRPQLCLWDGRRHRHGRIHYECHAAALSEHGLTFRSGGWYLVCDTHYIVLWRAAQAWRTRRHTEEQS